MKLIGARADDWRPGRPDVHPAAWIGGFIAALIFYYVIAAIIGHVINGNGSPFLSCRPLARHRPRKRTIQYSAADQLGTVGVPFVAREDWIARFRGQ